MQTITTRYDGTAASLESKVLVSKTNSNAHFSCTAIWDTGATSSMVTDEVVAALELESIGLVAIAGFHGLDTRPFYRVSIAFSKSLRFENLKVIGASSLDDCGILIGMDIISQLDFAVTNVGGNTTHSIRFPSRKEIDFESES